MASKKLQDMSGEDIKRAVAENYSQVALAPEGKFNFPVGRKFAGSVGYPAELLDALLSAVWKSFTGAGDPQPYADPQPGETVLDLYCGAGPDLCLYTKAVGEAGTLCGLDMSRDMIEKAQQSLEVVGVRNVKFRNAPADAIPLPDASVAL